MRIGNDFYAALMPQRQSTLAQNKNNTRNFASLGTISRDTVSFGTTKSGLENFKKRREEFLEQASDGLFSINKDLSKKYAQKIYDEHPVVSESNIEKFDKIAYTYSLHIYKLKDSHPDHGNSPRPTNYNYPWFAEETYKQQSDDLAKMLLLTKDCDDKISLYYCDNNTFKNICEKFKDDTEFVKAILGYSGNYKFKGDKETRADIVYEVYKDNPETLKEFLETKLHLHRLSDDKILESFVLFNDDPKFLKKQLIEYYYHLNDDIKKSLLPAVKTLTQNKSGLASSEIYQLLDAYKGYDTENKYGLKKIYNYNKGLLEKAAQREKSARRK